MQYIRALPDYAPDYVYRTNCIYHDEDDHPFFYPAGSRITALLPPDDWFLEQFTADLALHDALSVTAGGLYLDKAHIEQQAAFAAEYRKLPAVKFRHTILTDPVTIRWQFHNGKTWLYLLNREPYEVNVTFRAGENTQTLFLAPFSLKSFSYPFQTEPTVFSLKLPQSKLDAYRNKAATATAALQQAVENGPVWADVIPVLTERINKALEKEHWAELRYLLQSYFVKRALELFDRVQQIRAD